MRAFVVRIGFFFFLGGGGIILFLIQIGVLGVYCFFTTKQDFLGGTLNNSHIQEPKGPFQGLGFRGSRQTTYQLPFADADHQLVMLVP